MNIFRCRFAGRLLGAIGRSSNHDILVVAADQESALLEIYKSYMDIITYTVEQVEDSDLTSEVLMGVQ